MHLLPRPLYVLSVLIEDSKYVGGIAHAERIVRKEDVRNIIVSASCCDEALFSLSYLACTLPTTCLDPSVHLDEVVTRMSQPKDGVPSQDWEAAHKPGATRLAPLLVY